MKKFIYLIVFILSFDLYAKETSMQVKGFTDLQYAELNSAIENKYEELGEVSITNVNSRRMWTIIKYPFDLLGFKGKSSNEDTTFYNLFFRTLMITDGVEAVEEFYCKLSINKNAESGFLSLRLCKSNHFELPDFYIFLNKLGVKRIDPYVKWGTIVRK